MKWNSSQAERVRKVRAERDAALAEVARLNAVLKFIAELRAVESPSWLAARGATPRAEGGDL
jgi:hypothetical protein